MKMAGAVVKSAAILCPVESTNVRDLAMRAFVELVKCGSMLAATVVRLKRPYFALTVVTKSQVTKSIPPRTARTLPRNGLVCSLALTLAIAPSIVVSITARSLVTLKTPTLVTVLVLLTL